MDVERTIQFLLEQQAAAEARRGADEVRHQQWRIEMEADMTEFRKDLSGLQQGLSGLQQGLSGLQQGQAALQQSQAYINETQLRQLEMINRLVDVSAQNAAQFKETDERISALVAIVDGLVRRQN
jgi:hypothetical protein